MKRHKYFIFIVLALLISTPVYAAGWISRSLGVSTYVNDVYFSNTSTGWAVGGGGMVQRTTDGGSTWSAQSSGTGNPLYGVHFEGAIGWAVGSPVSSIGTIINSQDSGATWAVQTSGVPNETLRDVYFVDDSTGWVVGGSSTSTSGTILKTTDSGETWTSQFSDAGIVIYSVHFIDASTGWVVGTEGGTSGLIMMTENGGTTWSSQTSGTASTLRGVYFLDAFTGWVVGDGVLLITTNGGATWTSNAAGTGRTLRDVHFTDSANGWAAGEAGGEGIVINSTDGGATWTVQETLSSNVLSSLHMVTSGAGWAGGSGGLVIRYDGVPPSAPTGVVATTPASDNTPTFIWSDSSDDVGVTSYFAQIDAAGWEDLGDVLTATYGAPVEDGTHTFSIYAVDAAGNASTTVAYLFPIDTVFPNTTIDASPPAATATTSAEFAFSATEVATFECDLDGAGFAACTSPRTYTSLASSAHTFQVRATDGAGNLDPTPASYTWTITGAGDTTAPVVSGIVPLTATTGASVAFSAAYSDAVGVLQCELKVGGIVQGAMGLTGTALSGTAARNHVFLGPGLYVVVVSCQDGVGNVGGVSATASVTGEVITDLIAPDTFILAEPMGSTTTASVASFSLSASESDVTYACSLDSAPFTSCQTPKNYAGLAYGAHTFRARATDPSGNTDPTPASFAWTITTSPPDEPDTPSGLLPAGFFAGDRVKLANDGNPNTFGDTAVFYLALDGNRYVFPNDKTYLTWYANFDGVKTIGTEDIASIPLRGNVTYRPGIRMVKLQTNPTVYVVGRGGALVAVPSEADAAQLYGPSWNKHIDDINDAFWNNYQVWDPALFLLYNPSVNAEAVRTINITLELVEPDA